MESALDTGKMGSVCVGGWTLRTYFSEDTQTSAFRL